MKEKSPRTVAASRKRLQELLNSGASADDVKGVVLDMEQKIKEVLEEIDKEVPMEEEENSAIDVLLAMVELDDPRLKRLGIESEYALIVPIPE